MEPTFRERWIRRTLFWCLSKPGHYSNGWWPLLGSLSMSAVFVTLAFLWSSDQTVMPSQIYPAIFWAFLGLMQWERGGWIDYVRRREEEIRELRAWRDDLLQELEASESEIQGSDPETGYRES